MSIIDNMSNNSDYTGIVLEEIRDQNKAVIEAVGQMQDTMKTLATKVALQAVADDVKIIKSVLTDTNKDLNLHDIRLRNLEQVVLKS